MHPLKLRRLFQFFPALQFLAHQGMQGESAVINFRKNAAAHKLGPAEPRQTAGEGARKIAQGVLRDDFEIGGKAQSGLLLRGQVFEKPVQNFVMASAKKRRVRILSPVHDLCEDVDLEVEEQRKPSCTLYDPSADRRILNGDFLQEGVGVFVR